MWMFFEDGTFYSAVIEAAKGDDMFVVRTRDRRSAEILADYLGDAEIVELENRDYDYRLYVPRAIWDEFVSERVFSAKATNFKSEVARNIGYDHPMTKALGEIWSVMFNYQSKVRPTSRKKKGRKVGF